MTTTTQSIDKYTKLINDLKQITNQNLTQYLDKKVSVITRNIKEHTEDILLNNTDKKYN